MPLFENWEDKVSCGEVVEYCDPLTSIQNVRAVVGTEEGSNCFRELISPDHPAVLVAFSDVDSQLRSGTASRPIPVNLVQKTQSPIVPTIMFRNEKGELAVWDPPPNCIDKKVAYSNGSFKLLDDINSNVFDQACIGSYSDVEYIVGAREFTDCNDQTKFKLVFFPKSELPAFS